ncbi:MAG: TonB-dependent receptor, partial [Ignavibacteria bacterium]|nr:TonB-dependent receptor [Ignavibacteria bacterium]
MFFVSVTYSQNTADIYGIIRDKETQEAVAGATAEIVELNLKTESDLKGSFEFRNVPVGNYSIRFSALGYEKIIKTDVVVLSARPTVITVDLSPADIFTEEIEVRDRYFRKPDDFSTSSYNLDFEEVRRAPGAVEDVSRMLQVLAGVSPANDQRNDLIVRGGSPAENLITIDGIEVPNINHYPTQGSSSGPIGMINSKFINEVNFSSGGFPARYGDRLSSVMEIRFREGYRKKFLSDINLSTAGFGGIFEGPLFSKGSFLFSVRKSYLNLIRSAIRLAAVPDYWDFNLKTVYDLNDRNRLTLIGIAGIDKISFEGEASEVSDDNPYGKAKGNQQQFSTGFNLKTLFRKGYLQTIISNSSSFSDIENKDIITDEMLFYYNSYESQFSLKSELNYQLGKSNYLTTGISGRMIVFKNETFFRSDTTIFGEVIPEVNVNLREIYYKFSSFIQYRVKFLNNKVALNLGSRYDFFSGIKDKHVLSPRGGLSVSILPSTTLNLSTGIYFQSPAYLWISSDPENYNLRNIKAVHYVIGIDHLISSDLRLSVEAYYK